MALPKKTSLAILTFGVMTAGLGYAPGPPWLRLRETVLTQVLHFGPEAAPPAPVAAPSPASAAPESRRVLARTPLEQRDARQILDPAGIMSHFYESLARTERKEPRAVTQVLHYGDSPVTADSITADARAILQQRFGDAGHGFVLMAKPWAWYGHRGVGLRGSGWRIAAATQSRAKDGFHGLGGVSFEGGVGASATISLPDNRHTGMEVQFLQQPGGGAFHLEGNAGPIGDVSTDGETEAPGFASFGLPSGTGRVTLSVTAGTVRLFGWSFEKKGPGVIYHSLGLNGAQVQAVLWYFNAGQWTIELRHMHPDLVVINYGTNESVFPEYIERQYPGELRKLIERVKTALPESSVLVMSPMDRGERDSSGDIVTMPILPRIVDIQRKVAVDEGCAFFDTFDAMGGAGTMARWYESQPRMVSADFTHPLPGGAALVGRLLDDALMRGYARFRAGTIGVQ
jgi:lysophospholipase L1-like esterase